MMNEQRHHAMRTHAIDGRPVVVRPDLAGRLFILVVISGPAEVADNPETQ
jgi:hypothetical protein